MNSESELVGETMLVSWLLGRVLVSAALIVLWELVVRSSSEGWLLLILGGCAAPSDDNKRLSVGEWGGLGGSGGMFLGGLCSG